MVDGVPDTGFFASDFTLAEIKTLRAVQPFAERPQQFNGRFEIPTLRGGHRARQAQVAQEAAARIGIYPETKHPTYHQALGLPLEDRLRRALARAGWNQRNAPVFIQSFEQSNLKRAQQADPASGWSSSSTPTTSTPTASLDYAAPFDRPYDWTVSGDPKLLARTFGFLVTNAGPRRDRDLRRRHRPVEALHPEHRGRQTAPARERRRRTTSRPLAAADRPGPARPRARPARAYVDVPQRAAPARPRLQRQPVNEYLRFYELGVDGVFSDFADTAFAARELFRLPSGEGDEE